MAADGNEANASYFPSGVHIQVPDLTVARPLGTTVLFGGQLFVSTNASVATYVPVGGTDVVDMFASGALSPYGGNFSVDIPAGGGLPTVLNAPVAAGLFATVTSVVDGGGTISVQTAVAFNAAGNTDASFTAIDQVIHFVSVPRPTATGGFRWQLVHNEGTTLS